MLTGAVGWKTGSIWQAAESHPYKSDLIFTGYVSRKQLRALYSQTLAFVYPSEFEGFGLPIVEAMSCGAPVIAARNSSLTEVGGEAALYFETGNAEDLKEKMLQLSSHESLRKALLKALPEHIEKFSRENFARELMAQPEESVMKKKRSQ